MQIIKNISNTEKQCPNAINDCLFVNLMFNRAVIIMKSHANNIKLNELDSFLNVDLSDHSNSPEIE